MKLKKLSFLQKFCLNFSKTRFLKQNCSRYAHPQLAKLFFEQLWQMYFSAKQLYVSPHRVAADLPISLVLGEAKSGKTHLLNASRHILPQANYLNSDYQPMALRSMPRFLASPQRLYLELPQYLFVNESLKQVPYLDQLMRFLASSATLQKIRHVILTINAADLLNQDLEKLEEFWTSTSVMLERLPKSVQLYVVVTKLDLLQGFVEFFSDLSVEERQHAFGFMLDSNSNFQAQMQHQLATLTQRLQRRMWWRAQSEMLVSKRVLVAEFPKQFACLTDHLVRYLKPLMNLMKQNLQVQIKGCFFTSTKQEGQPLDILVDDQASLLATQREASTLPMLLQHREYFVRGFFPHLQTSGVMREDANVFSAPQERLKISSDIYKYFLSVIAVMALAAASVWGYAWWRVSHALSSQKSLAYSILSGHDIAQNLNQFISYELFFLPQPLQVKVAQSDRLHAWVGSNAKAYLNEQWQKEVYREYQKNIADKYPIAMQSSVDLPLATFNAFYGPQGTLESFDRRYLQSPAIQALFVQDTALINLYANLKRLQQALYQNNVAPSWSFSAYLNNLAEGVRTVDLMVVGTKMSLRPNVVLAGTFTWPNQMPTQDSGYAIEYAQSLPKMQVFQGTWSWVKLFAHLRWQRNDGSNDFTASSPNNEFSLIVNATQPIPELSALFAHLNVPQEL
ncbi:MAG: type secretion protein [Gammaproteobacteria bacterium]|jgi:type VI protein secretion system component VasK|nr:type secretion protein [Gammaproteobacteria bacterium]